MEQLSFFDAGLLPVTPDELGVILIAQGHSQLLFGATDTTRGRRRRPRPESARISVLVPQPWRAEQLAALAGECVCSPGMTVSVDRPDATVAMRAGESEDLRLVRIEGSALLPVVEAWTKGAVKTIPQGWHVTERAVQLWATVAGWQEDMGVLLGMDSTLAQQQDMCDRACEELGRVGAAASFVGPRAGGPALRVTGQRRVARLLTMMGEPQGGGSWVREFAAVD